MSQHLYLDVHILQTVPPANLNRDDSGSPKQAIYGGTRRSRVSSQAWKRATRKQFVAADLIPADELATRTSRITTLLTRRIVARFELDSGAAARVARALVAAAKVKPAAKKTDETAYLLFFGNQQLDRIIDLVADNISDLLDLDDEALTKSVETLPVAAQLASGHPLDVALFGRMVADIPNLNVDAATQVAHALSTHTVELEFDYYTAVDDEKERDEDADQGAGMIGTVEFNSATLYRYATLAVHRLHANLGGETVDTARGARMFLDAFARSMPTGHQNTFAHRTLPNLVVLAARTDQPVNLVGAYENPVRGGHHGVADESATRLAAEFTGTSTHWGNAPALTLATYNVTDTTAGKLRDAFGTSAPFPQMLDHVERAVTEWLATGAVQ